MKKYIKIMTLFLVFLCFTQEGLAQCYPTQIVTAAYATGGTSPYKDKVLWLTWGSTDQLAYPYGRHLQPLAVGAKSYASIQLGEGLYLCVEAEITGIGGAVRSYASGNYSGDSLDKLYNIGGTGTSNQLVAGIVNTVTNTTATLTLKAKATINGVPIRISGLVVADAESLDPINEYIRSEAKGKWEIIDVRKNTAEGPYNIEKNDLPDGSQQIGFTGNNRNTGAVALLSFNDDAYAITDYAVDFTAALRGRGFTALAIGLLTPNADLGDAPESYGAPVHLLQNLNVTSDGITAGAGLTNINTVAYNSGELKIFEGKHLGTKAPDSDNKSMYTKDAKGDDNSGTAGIDEEDAWPQQYRRFSYKANYMVGNTITATIAYKNAEVGDKISGWIDFNLNGIFDADERITASTAAGNGSLILEWSVPATRVPYNTYVRLRYFDKSEDATNPANSVNFGEVEDHRIYILTPTMTNPMLPSKSKIKK